LASDTLHHRAFQFLNQFYKELDRMSELDKRWQEVQVEIEKFGTWYQTKDELTFGARVAWRNSNRCIGRLYWKSLHVFDVRELDNESDVFQALEHHLEYAFNKGNIKSCIAIFRQRLPGEELGPRIINHQLLRFAGYRSSEGVVTGDPQEVSMTDFAVQLGWHPPHTAFDLLPLMFQWPGWKVAVGEIKDPERFLVNIEHPFFEWFRMLNLKWYAVPVIADMLLEIGGVEYTAAPFNGWYMGTEIGSRNFGDVHRYNLLPVIADRMGLDTSSIATLWKDRALVELNLAILHSFKKAGITISDHHEVAEQFVQFEQLELKAKRALKADWSWIVPPLSGSSTPVFHRDYDNAVQTPNFFYQDPFPAIGDPPQAKVCPFHSKSLHLKGNNQ